jgi:hypothetical protein
MFFALDGKRILAGSGFPPFALINWVSGVPEEAGLPNEAVPGNGSNR